MGVRRPFEVRQWNETLGEDIIIRVDHESVDRISIELDHPLYDEAQSAVLTMESAQNLLDVLEQAIEEQKARSLFVFMAQV